MVSLEFKTFVVEEINRHWAMKGEPMLLAKLGQAAASRGFVLQKELQGLKLSQFIQLHLADELDVLSPDDSGTVLRVRPKNPAPVEPTASSDTLIISQGALNRALVSAFSQSLPNGCERWIRIEAPIHYTDAHAGDGGPAGYVRIDRAYLIAPESPADAYQPASVLARIADWTTQAEIELQRFVHKSPRQERGEKTLLALLMESLTESELKRVSLPLDIVGKLMRK